MSVPAEVVDAFIRAACVPRHRFASHAEGSLDEAERIRSANPEVAAASLHAAATVADDVATFPERSEAMTLYS